MKRVVEDGLEPVAVRFDTAARMLDCSYSTIWKLSKDGVLKTIKVGADNRVLVESIRALVAQRAAA
jgi:hypothetical protein